MRNIRTELLEGMCRCAEEIALYRSWGNGIHFVGETPTSFKPGVGDKFLFNKILDNILPEYEPDYIKKDPGGNRVLGAIIMSWFYYPNYEWCDRQDAELARGLSK